MEKYNLPASLREDFIKSLDRMSREKVDVHLGNHIQDCYHFEKLSLIKEIDNPFINPSSWNLFLDKKKAEAKAEFKWYILIEKYWNYGKLKPDARCNEYYIFIFDIVAKVRGVNGRK